MLSLIYEALLLKINQAINTSLQSISESESGPDFKIKFAKLNNKVILVKIKNFIIDLDYYIYFNVNHNNNILIKNTTEILNPDLIIKLSLSGIIKTKTSSIEDALHNRDIEFDGDLNLAMVLQSLLNYSNNIDIFNIIQENLENYTGSKYFAWQFVAVLRIINNRIADKHDNLKEQISDYLLIEKNIIVNKYELEDYYSKVDNLRDAVERLTAKINRLKYAS